MELRSSTATKRKPLSNISNVPKPYPNSSAALKSPICPSFSTSSIASNTTANGYGGEFLKVGIKGHETKKAKSKGAATAAMPLNNPSLAKTKGRGEQFSVAVRPPEAEKTRDKGNAIVVPSSRSHSEHADNIVKGVSVPLSGLSSLKEKDKGKAIDMPLRDPSVKSGKNDEKDKTATFSNLALMKIKNKGKAVDVSGGLLTRAKVKDKGEGVCTPINNLTLDKIKVRSCPPPLMATNKRNEPSASGGLSLTKSHSDIRLNKKKRLCSRRGEVAPGYSLPKEFVEQQRAYFKEIDEFELQEEEVSDA